jgi:hypothetical protein
MRRLHYSLVLALFLPGCDTATKQPDFPDLHPVKGVVKLAGKPVNRGVVQFTSVPERPEFLVNSEVGDDGTFTLSTVRTTDKRGERKPGAPPGRYRVTYSPPLGDQTAGPVGEPITAPQLVTVSAGTNELTIELPKKK